MCVVLRIFPAARAATEGNPKIKSVKSNRNNKNNSTLLASKGARMSFPLLLLSACTLSALLTLCARRYALWKKVLDVPGERRSHHEPTPRGGGVAVVVVMLLALLAFAFNTPDVRSPTLLAAAGLALVAAIGWWDDHRPIPASWRFAVHLLAALMLAAAVHQSDGGWLATALAAISALVLINVWNFMDGIDGIAASQALIAAIGYALLNAPGAWLGWVLAAALAGFLPFNFPKAKIFLGDVGSGAIGYALALLIALNLISPPPKPELLLLPVSVFMTDASLTLLRRVARGEPWWQAHVQHAYQRWARGKASHIPVTLAYALASVIATGLMFSQDYFTRPIMLVWLLCLGLVWARVQHRYRYRPDGQEAA